MNRMRALLTGATAAGAIAAGSFLPAHAGSVVDQDLGGAVHLQVSDDGSAALTMHNDPGYLAVSGSAMSHSANVCVGTDQASATCLSDLVPAAPGEPTVPGLPAVPGLPPVPGAPSAPALPPVPGLPTAPGLPSATDLPSIPGVPTVPGLPAVPGLDALRDLGALPGLGSLPTVPGLPGLPALPAFPGLPAL